MTPEEKIEMGRKLIAEAEAEIAAKKRNWPEKVEPGMVFQSPVTTATWMATDVDGLFVCLKGETDSFKAAGRTMRLNRENIPHAGHARDILTIRTDAHEPTGAELVGKMCMFRGFNLGQDDTEEWLGPWVCQAFDPDDQESAYKADEAGDLTGWYKEARLAKEEA